jgi:hypothetical protein
MVIYVLPAQIIMNGTTFNPERLLSARQIAWTPAAVGRVPPDIGKPLATWPYRPRLSPVTVGYRGPHHRSNRIASEYHTDRAARK